MKAIGLCVSGPAKTMRVHDHRIMRATPHEAASCVLNRSSKRHQRMRAGTLAGRANCDQGAVSIPSNRLRLLLSVNEMLKKTVDTRRGGLLWRAARLKKRREVYSATWRERRRNMRCRRGARRTENARSLSSSAHCELSFRAASGCISHLL